MSHNPTLAVTIGDPAGIGPEVIVGAWGDARIHECCRPFVVGDAQTLRRVVELLHRDINVVEIDSAACLSESPGSDRTIPCWPVKTTAGIEITPARVDARAGEVAYQAVCLAAMMALAGEIDGLVTAPLSKAALHAAGHHYPGHTELLAELCGVTDFAMMLYLPAGDTVAAPHGLGVAHVTLHQSLRSVFADLTPDAVLAKCHLADTAMRRLGVAQPRIAVCALNPHGGEDGLFGDEECTVIGPAVVAARAAGLDARGPFPTDTLMPRARDGEFDAVVAMYHDQGHIALKLLNMHEAVNITLGLPIVRTSVAHGTAFDRAWQGTARWEGMVAAIQTAAKLVNSGARRPVAR